MTHNPKGLPFFTLFLFSLSSCYAALFLGMVAILNVTSIEWQSKEK